jgi:hypothetical protein
VIRPGKPGMGRNVALSTSNLLDSRDVWGPEVASALPWLSGTQLTGPFPATAAVTAGDLNNAGWTLVSVDGGVESVACLGAGTSWARVADFTSPAFSATGNALVQKDVIAGNRTGGSSSGVFVTVDGLKQEIRRKPILPSARSSTMSTALGLSSGSGRMVTSGRRSQLKP